MTNTPSPADGTFPKSRRERGEELLGKSPGDKATNPTGDVGHRTSEAGERRIRRLIDAVTDYVYRVKVEGGRAVETIHGANCEAVTGYTPEEFAENSMLWIAMVPQEDRPAVARQAASILSGQQTPSIEHRIRRKDGTVCWVANTVVPQFDDAGRLIGYDGLLRDITERKQVEDELRDREQKLQAVFDNTFEFIGLLSPDGTVLQANRSSLESIAADASEVIGRPFWETPWWAHGPKQRRRLREAIDRAKNGEFDRFEATHRTSDGQVIYIDFSVSPVRDDSGQVVLLVPEGRNITKRKESEGALRALNAALEQRVAERTVELQQRVEEVNMLATAVEHLAEGVLITDDDRDWPDPRIVFVNQAMCRISGYSALELIGRTPRVMEGQDTQREEWDRLKRELSEGRPCQSELVQYRKDGSSYDAELFVAPLVNSEGRRTHFVSVFRDITERRRIEDALRKSENQIVSILNAVTDAIITIDKRGLIVAVNPATERMFHYTAAELLGRNVGLLMPPPFCDEHDAYITRYRETRRAKIIGIGREVVARRKDGSTFPVDLVVSEVDHLELFTGIVRDISERKALEWQLLQIAGDEQRRIGQALHDDVGQELMALTMMAKTLAEEIAEGSPPDLELSERIATQIKSCFHRVRLLSHGLVPVEVDSEGLMSALMQLTTRFSELYGVPCTFRCPERVAVEDNQIATHLFHIAKEAMTNAVKHGQGTSIEVALTSQDNMMTLSVQDNGKGIAKESPDAHGIGLRIMRYRANLIRANLTVSPLEPGGTLVTCRLIQPDNRR